jgi:hypothetical protein
VYPTLSDGNFNVSFSGKKNNPLLLVVRNTFGQEFYSKGFLLDNDRFFQPLDLSAVLTPGIYMVIASSDDRVFSKRIVVRKD